MEIMMFKIQGLNMVQKIQMKFILEPLQIAFPNLGVLKTDIKIILKISLKWQSHSFPQG